MVAVLLALAPRALKRLGPRQQATPPLESPSPDVRILSLRPTGGVGGYVDFVAELANYGSQAVRARFAATVGGQPATCQPEYRDLLVNAAPETVRVIVPRPQLGELVKEFDSETTLYGRDLVLEASINGDVVASTRWAEKVYSEGDNRTRWEIQQREWRFGRGEATEADERWDAIRRLR